MKLKVPFFKQTTPLNCGPMALRMVLAYLGNNEEIRVLEEKIGINKGKGISTIQIANAAASLGYKTKFYSKHVSFNEEHLKQKFYQEYSDMDLEKSEKLLENAKSNGVNIQEKTLPLEKLLEFVTKNSVPIILLDWNVVMVRKEKGYQGHFVPIVGYDEQNVYIHNPGLDETQEFMPILRNVFDEARKADGTDEDILIISN